MSNEHKWRQTLIISYEWCTKVNANIQFKLLLMSVWLNIFTQIMNYSFISKTLQRI